jgi:glutamyl-Q tRNA(Asp) synthetase
MASYADARAAGGQWLLRIEDVDLPRVRKGAADQILHALERHGFAWDGPVWRQSARRAAYEAALAQLAAHGLTYACACTRRELATHPVGAIGERVYAGTCRNVDGVAPARRGRIAVRVRVSDAPIAFTDRLLGEQRQRLAADVGDFVVRRSDGLFAYQLAVVVDDAAQEITDVVRGADLLASTPRQIFLQRALHLHTPRYLHIPVAVDAEGIKLSKQTAAAALPASPLPALTAAWRFLGQTASADPPSSVHAFWSWAIANWRPAQIPRVLSRPVRAPCES